MADLSDATIDELYGEARRLVPADVYTSEHGEVIPYDPDGPQPVMLLPPKARPPFDFARWLVNRLRDRKSKGQRVRRLVMNSDSYVDLFYCNRRFVPVATVDAVLFEGLPISIDESYSFREVGFNG